MIAPIRYSIFLMLVVAAPGFGDDRASGPLAPAVERATFRLADPELMIELVAAEPEVVSPVAIAWDEDERMYVAEMIDYPASATAGRIKRLEDRDGDGVYEHATTFAEGLPFPNGVLPWKGGVLVTAAPNIWFLKDNDGDGRADERRVVLTGFGVGNTQLRVNGLFLGLDNWIYGANGRSDGAIRRPNDPAEKAVSIRRRDFRFQPETGAVEAIAGFSQFGLAHDDWGHRFPSWNTVPIRHVVIEERDLSRNPYLAESSSVAAILDTADGGRIYSISPTQARFNRESVAFFNASCGTTIYRGDPYRGNAFVCEPLTNLVHRRVLVPAGSTFLAKRVEQGKEFLAATDPAFRPVNLANGPDGALYVVDFYRELVEHPQFVPEEARKKVDFRRWHDRGRIWRIRPRTAAVAPKRPRPKGAELVAALGHPNGWRRDTAQRLLLEQGRDAGIASAVVVEARDAVNPLGRLHALAVLQGMGLLDQGILIHALRDPDAGIREHALRTWRDAKIASAAKIAPMADDPEIRVRLQAALALGDYHNEAELKALARIAGRDASDEWMRLAILSGLGETAWPFLQILLDAHPGWVVDPTPEQGRLLSEIAAIVGARKRDGEVDALLGRLVPGPGVTEAHGQIALAAGLSDGLARARSSLGERLGSTGSKLDRLWVLARAVVVSDRAPTARRVVALRVLAQARPDALAGLLDGLLRSDQPPLVQSATARAIADAGRPELVATVLDHWPGLAIGTRRELLATLLGASALAARLVEAMENQTIGLAELDPSAREALRRLPDPALRPRVERLLAKAAPADRGGVVRQYQAALTMTGDARRGAEVFAKNCRTCHQHQGQGNRVGPDLSGIAGRPAEALLADILDPSREVAPDYVAFLLVTKSGQVASGLLVEETAASLKLRRAEGVEQAVLRSEIEELRGTGRSLMPDGLEQAMSVSELADLLAFLKQPTASP